MCLTVIQQICQITHIQSATPAPPEKAIGCRLAGTGSLFMHGASPESTLNHPQQASAEKFAGNFASPPQRIPMAAIFSP